MLLVSRMIYAISSFYFVTFSVLLEVDIAWRQYHALVRRAESKRPGGSTA